MVYGALTGADATEAALRRFRFMRLLLLPILLPILLLATGFDVAEAAQPSWLDGLFVAKHPVVHRVGPKVPVTQPPAVAAVPAEIAPVPMPRPRPDLQAVPQPEAPVPLPVAVPPLPPVVAPVPPDALPLPRPRPASETPAPIPAPTPAPATTPAPTPTPQAGEGLSPNLPAEAPKEPRVYQTACPAVIAGQVEAKALPPISERMCGEQSPLSVTGVLVNGRMVPLSIPVTVGCPMATQLPVWASAVDSYLFPVEKTRIKSLDIGGSYECRERNVVGSTDVSEHGRADAIDFNGFTFEDGRKVRVDPDYSSADPAISRFMHFAHDAACTSFTTVLGPDANADHHDHFHLDLGCHGKTCTYRLCE